jgi:hypothetical protein
LNTFQEVENGQGLSCGDGEAWLVFDANASLFPAALLQMQTAQRQAITPSGHGPQGAVSAFRDALLEVASAGAQPCRALLLAAQAGLLANELQEHPQR